jgi:hypothetical protein
VRQGVYKNFAMLKVLRNFVLLFSFGLLSGLFAEDAKPADSTPVPPPTLVPPPKPKATPAAAKTPKPESTPKAAPKAAVDATPKPVVEATTKPAVEATPKPAADTSPKPDSTSAPAATPKALTKEQLAAPIPFEPPPKAATPKPAAPKPAKSVAKTTKPAPKVVEPEPKKHPSPPKVASDQESSEYHDRPEIIDKNYRQKTEVKREVQTERRVEVRPQTNTETRRQARVVPAPEVQSSTGYLPYLFIPWVIAGHKVIPVSNFEEEVTTYYRPAIEFAELRWLLPDGEKKLNLSHSRSGILVRYFELKHEKRVYDGDEDEVADEFADAGEDEINPRYLLRLQSYMGEKLFKRPRSTFELRDFIYSLESDLSK